MSTRVLCLLAFLFSLAFASAQAPANDVFANAVTISGATGTTSGNNSNASTTNEVGEPEIVETFNGSRSVWYSWQAPGTASVTFTLSNPSFDSQLSAYTGSAVGSLTSVRESDKGGGGEPETITFNATAGTTYRIRVAGYDDEGGAFTLNWSTAAVSTGQFTVFDAEVDENDPTGVVTVTVTRVGSTTGTVTVDYETADEIAEDGLDYEGTSGTLTFANGEDTKTFTIEIDDDALLEGFEYFYVFLSNPTNGSSIDNDTAFITIVDNEHPANDNFANAQDVGTASGTVQGTNLSATTEGTESEDSVWYRWTAPASATPTSYIFSATSGTIAPILSVFTGASLNSLVPVTGNQVDNGFAFDATGGAIYYIRITEDVGDQGAFALNWKASPGVFRFVSTYIDETAGSVQVTVLREFGSGGAVSVDYRLESLTADPVDDYADPGQVTLNFADGQTSATFNVTINDDALLEGYETFEVNLLNPTGGTSVNEDLPSFVAIVDNEHPANDNFASATVISGDSGLVSSTNLSSTREAGEFFGDRTVWYKWSAPEKGYFSFTLNGGRTIDVFQGSTLAGLQLLTSGENVQFPANPNDEFYLRVRSITVFDDGDFELSWEELEGTFSIQPATVSEGAGQVLVTILREKGDKGELTIDYETSDSNAAAGADYVAKSDSVTFADGELSKTITIAITQDSELEGAEDFFVELSGVDVTFGSTIATVVIQDDEHPANDNLANAQLITGAEGSVDGVRLNATLEPGEPTTSSFTVWYRWTAPAAGVYEFTQPIEVFTGTTYGNLSTVSSTSIFAAVAGKEYRIRVGGDQSDFTLDWALASGTFRLVTASSVAEGAGTLTFTVLRENGSAGEVDVDYSFEDVDASLGDDYDGTDGTLTFASGETTKTFTVSILQDSDVEGPEYFRINLSTGGQSIAPVQVKINDDDRPVNDSFAAATQITNASGVTSVSLLNASREAGEPTPLGAQTPTVWFRWTAPGDGAVRFFNDDAASMAAFTGGAVNALTLVASDHTGLGMTFAVTAGTTYRIAVGGNSTNAFDLHWSFSAGGAFEIASGFTESSDGAALVRISEKATQLVFTVKRTGGTGAASLPFHFADDSATIDEDYTGASGTLQFAGGEVLKTITVPITNDNAIEGDESFSLILDTPTPSAIFGNVRSASITIDDDDDNPSNDLFADAIALDPAITAGSTVIGNIEGAGHEAGEPLHYDLGGDEDGRTIWYSFTAPSNGVLDLSGFAFQNDDPDHTHSIIIAVYTGASLQDLEYINSSYEESRSMFVNVAAGTKYQIAVETDLFNDFNHTQGISLTYAFSASSSPTGATFHLSASFPREGTDATVAVTVFRSGNTAGTDTVKFFTSDDNATAGADYIALSVPVTFAPGETEKVIPIPILSDSVKEGFEGFTCEIDDLEDNFLWSYYVSIEDDDDDPANDQFANASVLTGASGLVHGTTLGASSENQEPDLNRYESVWYRWTAPATGVARFFIDLSHFTAVYTGNSLANLSLVASGEDGVAFGAIAGRVYYIAISDFDGEDFDLSFVTDSTQSVFNLKSSYTEVDEAAGTATVAISRVGNLSGGATVGYSTQSLSGLPVSFGFSDASAGFDFTAKSGTLAFGPGETVKYITIPILDDTDIEDFEAIGVVISSPSGALLGSNYFAALAIIENDDDPENDEFANAIVLTGESGSINGFNYGADTDFVSPLNSYDRGAISGVWYRWTSPITGRASFAIPDSNFGSFLEVYRGTALDALVIEDGFYSSVAFDAVAGETYMVLVQTDPFSGEVGDFTLSWAAETLPTVNFSASTYTVNEDAGTATLTITLSAAAASAVTVDYYTDYDNDALPEDDYTDVEEAVTFAPGETSKTISIPILSDTVFEGDETFRVVLSEIDGPVVRGLVNMATVKIVDAQTLLPFKAKFNGLVEGNRFSHASNGALSLALTAKGTFSGKLTWAGKKYNFKGTFDTHGVAEVTIKRRPPLPPLVLRLAITEGGTQIGGTVKEGGITSNLDGDKLAFSKTALYSKQGDFTVLFPGVPQVQGEVSSGRPVGHGYAKMNVSKLGLAKFAGVLADGSKISLGVQVSLDDEVPVYLPLYGSQGVLTGKLVIEEEPGVSDADGRLSWFKPAGLKKQKAFPNGIDEEIEVIASRYVYTKGQRVVLAPDGNGALFAGAGNLGSGVGQSFDLDANNRVSLTATPAGSVKISIAAKSGLFKGSFIPQGERKAVPFGGVLFQKQNIGGGFFLKADGTGLLQSGFVEVAAENP